MMVNVFSSSGQVEFFHYQLAFSQQPILRTVESLIFDLSITKSLEWPTLWTVNVYTESSSQLSTSKK